MEWFVYGWPQETLPLLSIDTCVVQEVPPLGEDPVHDAREKKLRRLATK